MPEPALVSRSASGERHGAIVRNLRRNGTSTVDPLAKQVGASRRTVMRDISALRDEGQIIYSDVGRGGWLQLDPRSMQTTAKLSVSEIIALLISVAATRAAGNLPFYALADAGLAKIEKALPAEKVKDLRTFWTVSILARFHRCRTCRM
ncbi:HTH domain-containing protein [Ruegeria sp. SCPT10]|uniref:helix-turn-helix transcriptional regulator n=1 Tax=Ruegeria sp. SCP10 TaxID=3141377 RepID=UPI0033396E62